MDTVYKQDAWFSDLVFSTGNWFLYLNGMHRPEHLVLVYSTGNFRYFSVLKFKCLQLLKKLLGTICNVLKILHPL